jgi:hypothetical protein
VIVNTLSTNKLFAVPIEKDGQAGVVNELKLDQPIYNPDGMRALNDGTLLVAESGHNGRVSLVNVEGDQARVTTVEETFPQGVVAVASIGQAAWVLSPKPAENVGHERSFRAVRVALPIAGSRGTN